MSAAQDSGAPALLYPQIPTTEARQRAEELRSLSLPELEERSELEPSGVVYTPTGGSRVETPTLEQLRDGIRKHAHTLGYPSPEADFSRFDSFMTSWLHQHMPLRPSEACRSGVWSFVGLYLTPELARWRFPGRSGSSSPARFLGQQRGIRNVLGRLWWRAEYLRQRPGTFIYTDLPTRLDERSRALLTNQPYGLVMLLGEDELVGITERPTLSGNRAFCRSVARALIVSHARAPGLNRSGLLRDAMKRIYRLGGIMTFEALDEATLFEVLCGVFDEAAATMRERDGQTTQGASDE